MQRKGLSSVIFTSPNLWYELLVLGLLLIMGYLILDSYILPDNTSDDARIQAEITEYRTAGLTPMAVREIAPVSTTTLHHTAPLEVAA